ncbi:ABC transporter permease [Paenibacillus koleovorans]|uniref:ABC transporter permease n=1 Tax=Paenibacillus koleovorans TaxID=121608 RepID=UPI000FD9E563|nr:ABC transporter permease [Paenibacillus koleovorans]
MVSLILNENMKLYRHWRTWIMIFFMIGTIIFATMLNWYYDRKDAKEMTWQQQVTEQKQRMEHQLSNPDLNEESRRYYQDRIALIDYRLAHEIRPTDDTMWDGINGGAELVIMITLFLVIVAGDSLAGEFSSGTIKLLLIRPASRLKVLLAKYVSMLMYGILLLVILFVCSTLLNGLLYQFNHMNLTLLDVNAAGQVVELNMVANLWKSYLLNGVSTIMFVTMAFMITAAFRSSAMAIGFSIFALFGGMILTGILQPYAWSKYLIFPNLLLEQYLGGRPYQDGMTLGFSIIVLCVYFAVFNLVSWLVFTRRDVAA